MKETRSSCWKIVQGRIGKFYGEICLVEQDFVKDPDQKVGKLVESKGAKIVRFARFEKVKDYKKRRKLCWRSCKTN